LASAASLSSVSVQKIQLRRATAGGASATATVRAMTGMNRLPSRALSSSSQPQTGEATQSGLTQNTTVSAAASNPLRRSCQGSPGAMSLVSRNGSKPRCVRASTSMRANAVSLRE
jgi:hypothetical protein